MNTVSARRNSIARQLIRELQGTKGARIECPCCYESKPASRYLMFTADHMPDEVRQLLKEQEAEQKSRRLKHDQQKSRLEAAAEHAQRTNFGNFAERLLPATPEFPGTPADYRHLGSPIDYIGFHGLTMTGAIEAIDFVDTKAGGAKPTANQRLIANAVARGRVSVSLIGGNSKGSTGAKRVRS